MTPKTIEVQAGIQKCKSWSDEFWLDLVDLVATQSHCNKKKVGCVIVDKRKRLVSMGVNGTLAGMPNKCEDDNGKTIHREVLHAEMNALANADRKIKGCTAYLNYSPCENCAKTLLQFGIAKLVIRGEVKDQETLDFVIEYLGEKNVKVW